MDRAQKEQTVAAFSAEIANAGGMFLAHNLGLRAAATTDLRRKGKAAGAKVQVVKNRLVARAIKGTQYEGLTSQLTGPTVIVYGEDPFALTKFLVGFSKGNDKLKVIGGAMGSEMLDAKAVEALSKMPSLNELRATIVGLLQAPASKMARVLNAYATKDEGGEQPQA